MKRILIVLLLASATWCGCGDSVSPTPEYSTRESIPTPTEIRVQHSAVGALITWVAPDSDFILIQGWHVYREDPGGAVTRLTPAPVEIREFEDRSEPVIGLRRYWVTALSWGGVESLESEKGSYVYDEDPPAAPTDLRWSQQPHGIILQWLAGLEPDLRNYTVYRDGVAIAFVSDPGMPVYFDLDVVVGRTYVYYVTVTDFSGFESPASNTVTAEPGS